MDNVTFSIISNLKDQGYPKFIGILSGSCIPTEKSNDQGKINMSIQYNPDETCVNSMKSKLSTSFVPRWREEPCSIFRVPPILRMQKPEVDEPRILPIGPYH
ncbi:hypothetical protein QJS10_CPB17g01118 [Acorus calamus]|uniref:Uncharacterized protein n=1 Tax=Acorus calamus TaxID=4465 RepID=A0AAV9CQS0_ACOCL|nr:hypothetical protein QJS10_CPB17g01118 [Acorus calamus]